VRLSHAHVLPPHQRPISVNALTQLEDLVKEKKYGEVAQTLAVSVIMSRILPIADRPFGVRL
jgi:hypothetical protein